jgi:DNA segregation ATPase FtsK/SpoIIIE-like protein
MEQNPSTLLSAAADLVRSRRVASVSLLQRRFGLGYAAAVDLMEQLQASGIVTAVDGNGARASFPAAAGPRHD